MRWLAGLLVLSLALPALGAEEGCGICHGKERVLHEESVHALAKLSCVDCHGGDPTQVESAEKAHEGFRGRVPRTAVAEVCGTCHADVVRMRPFALRTDVLAAYQSSHHGQALAKGDVSAAVCTDCHGDHDVRRTVDPRSPAFRVNVPATCGSCHGDEELMAAKGMDTSAVAEYAEGVHGQRLASGAPGVPSCADCHDAHAATPPGATEVADVCGHCHAETRDRFLESPHAAASESGALEQCVTCHSNHRVLRPDFNRFDRPAKDGEDSGARCLDCHDGKSEDDRAADVARRMGEGYRSVDAHLREAEAKVDAMEADGFYVDDERDSLAKAQRELVRAVPLSHSVDIARLESALRRVRSLVDEALIGRDGRLREARDRRIYGSLAGLLLLGIAGFMALWRRKVIKP